MKRVTLTEVAQHAGVSRATASLVVRGTGRLSDDTRDRVHASMTSLGYVYHRGAASLRLQKTSIVGLIVTDISNPFFASLAVSLEEALAERGYLMMLTNTFDDPVRQAGLVAAMIEHPVDALVYVPAQGGDVGFAAATASARNTPALAVTRRPSEGLAYLGADDQAGGRIASQHLLSVHGRLRLVYLGGPAGASTRSARLAGVRESITHVPGARLVADLAGETNVDSGIQLSERLLNSGIEFDGVICHSDLLSAAFIHTLRQAKRSLSGISVIGFDGLPEGGLFEPTLTTVSVGPRDLGRRIADRILRMIGAGLDNTAESIRPALIVRASCGC